MTICELVKEFTPTFIEEDIGSSNINYKIFDINPIQSIQITDSNDGINYES